MELIAAGFAGFSESRRLYFEEETHKKLLDRYPKSFFRVLEEPVDPAAAAVWERELPGAADRESTADGGVFGAMWRLLKRNRLGASFRQKEIPVLQQTIEICEMLALDPYRLPGEGGAVLLSEDGYRLVQYLEENGIPSRIIGCTEKGPAIRRTDGTVISYLRRPEPLRKKE